jgi:hypothetical protein
MAKSKGPKSLEEKLRDMDDSFADEVRLSTTQQIKDRLLKLDKYECELEDARSDDEDLKSKREQLKVANETYSVPLKAIKLKRAFSMKVLTEKSATPEA